MGFLGNWGSVKRPQQTGSVQTNAYGPKPQVQTQTKGVEQYRAPQMPSGPVMTGASGGDTAQISAARNAAMAGAAQAQQPQPLPGMTGGSVYNPIPMGPVPGSIGGMPGPLSPEQFKAQGSGAPLGGGLQEAMRQVQDPRMQREQEYNRMTKMAQDYASQDPNSMVCQACGGSGVKRGKQA